MIKFFYAVGDSFVWGHELHPDGPEFDTVEGTLFSFTSYKRKHCYTGIMADQLGIQYYQNAGLPGGSNERSYRMLINNLSKALVIFKPEEIFVNIGLTHLARREFCSSDLGSYYAYLASTAPSAENYPIGHQLWQSLVKDFTNDYGDHTLNVMMVLGMQNFLRTNKIPYLITASMKMETINQQRVIKPELLAQIIKNRYYVVPSFAQFVKENNYKLGPLIHPLEEGHAAWADRLLKYIAIFDLLGNSDL